MIHCLRGRVLRPELLDTLPFERAWASLGDLVRINRRWGGHSALKRLLAQAVRLDVVRPDEAFSLLDVGAASGDMGVLVKKWYPRARVTSLDRVASHLKSCVTSRVAADAFSLPFARGSFDVVFCSLFLHHFTDQDIVRLLVAFGTVARRAVLVIDLERNPIAYYFLPWTKWLFGWDAVTVNDGPISVEAAFRPRELEKLAGAAGLVDPWARLYRSAFRIGMIAGVP